jgi:molybdate transport system ATP-binding protein
VELKGAKLGYPASSRSRKNRTTLPIDYAVNPPTSGGHVILGRNGSGKSLLAQALVSPSTFVVEGSISGEQHHTADNGAQTTTGRMRKPPTTANVSFQSHEEMLLAGGSVSKAILGSHGGVLSPAARFLAVRFGLFPFLSRDVRTLSTGEIRKVLLCRALAQRPQLLILDHAFDGLDVASRKALQQLISKTLKGFRPDILVQGVDAKAVAHTQVVLVTHRPQEEMVDEMETISVFRENGSLETILRQGKSGDEIHQMLQTIVATQENDQERLVDRDIWWNDPTLPSVEQVATWWRHDRDNELTLQGPSVSADNLHIQKGNTTILQDLNWTVSRSQRRWLIAGGNGTGKSTLSRLLAKYEDDIIQDGFLSVFSVSNGDNDGDTKITPHPHPHMADRRPGVGWFSTELHISLARSKLTAREIISGCDTDTLTPVAQTVAQWLSIYDDELLSRPFSTLSQGEQKLTLIAAALASRPPLLVLDEPSQGLDQIHRRRLLALVERICQATEMNLVFITHHMEEVLPSISHVLHLHEGRDVYQGSRDKYDPDYL